MSEVIKKEKDTGLSLGDRIKKYENITRSYLIQKMPVIVRVDGRAFHSYTKQKWCEFPYSTSLNHVFKKTTLKVCEETMNVVLAYHQSDEVSFLLKDYDSRTQQQLFDGNIQKIVSTFASKFTYWFNKYISEELWTPTCHNPDLHPAEFDARAFNIPIHEVVNYFIWRQKDWERNSLSQYASSFFSHKELANKNSSQKNEMIALRGEKPWETLDHYITHGTFFNKVEVELPLKELSDEELGNMYIEDISKEHVIRRKWIINHNSPKVYLEKEFINKIVNPSDIESY